MVKCKRNRGQERRMSGVNAWTQDIMSGMMKSINTLSGSVKFWTGIGLNTDLDNLKASTQTSDAIKQSSVNSQQLNVVAAITTQFLLKTTIEQTYFQQSGLSITPIAYLAHDIAQMTDLFGISSSAYGKQLATIIASALSVFSFASLGFSFFASASGLWELDQLEHAPMLMAYFATIVCAPVVINKIVDHFFGNSEYQSVKPWIKAISKSLVSFIPKVSTSAAGVLYQFPNKQRWTTLVKPFQQFKAEWQTLAFNETNPWQPIASHKARKLFTRLERSYNLTTNQILADNVLYADTDCFKTIDSNHFVGCTLSESSLVPNPFKSGAFPFWASTSLAEGGTGFLVTFQPPTTARFHFDAIFTIGGFNCSNTITSIAQCTKKPEYASEVRYNTYVLDRNPIHNGNITNLSGDDGLFRGLPYSGFITDPDGDEVIQSVSLARSGADVPQFWSVDARTGVNQGAYIYKHAGVWSAIQTGTSALDGTPGETYDRQVMVVDSKIHLPFTLSLPPGTIAVNRELTANHVAYSGQAFSLPTGELFATSDSSPITNIEFVTESPAITYSRSRGVLEFDTTQDHRFYPNTTIPMVHTGYFLGTAESGETCRLFPLDCTPYPPATAITSNVSITELNSNPFFTRSFSPFIANIGGAAGFVIQAGSRSDADAVDIAGLTCSFEMQDGGPLLPGMVPSGCSIFWDIPRGTEIKTHNVNAYLHDSHGGVSAPEVLSFIVQATGVSNLPGLPDEIGDSTVHKAGSTSILFPLQNLDLDPATMVAELEPSVVISPSHPSIVTTWNPLTQEYDLSWNFPDSLTDTTQNVLFSIGQVSYRAEIRVTNPGPALVDSSTALANTTGLVGTPFEFNLLDKFTHIDGAAVLSVSGSFPNGLSIGADGVVRGTIAQRTARETPYEIDLTVCDAFGDIGRCILPAPKLSLRIPRSVPVAANYPATSVSVNPLKVEGDPEFTGMMTVSDPDGYDDLICTAPSNIPILRMNSDCTFGVDVRHGLQRDYGDIPVTVKNDDGLSTIVNLPLNVPRGNWGFSSTMPDRFTFNLGQPGSIRLCQYIFDGDVASGCSHLQTDWTLPASLQGATADGTSLDIFAALGSQAQGNYTVTINLNDRLPTPGIRTKQIVVSYNSHAPEISSSAVLAFAGQEDGPDVIVPYPGVDDLDGDPFDAPPTISDIPARCERQDSANRLVCRGLGPGVYEIQFSYTDPQGLGVSTIVDITIDPLPEGPNFWQQHWPKILSGLLSATVAAVPIALLISHLRRISKAHEKIDDVLPHLIQIAAELKAKFSKTTPQRLRGMSMAGMSTPRANKVTRPADATGAFAMSMPLAIRRMHQTADASVSSSASETKAQPLSFTGRAKASTLGVDARKLAQRITALISTIGPEEVSISPIKPLFKDYFKLVDQYFDSKLPNIVTNCNLLSLLLDVSKHLNKLVTGTGNTRAADQITLDVEMMVNWLNKLTNRFVNYFSGLQEVAPAGFCGAKSNDDYTIKFDEKWTVLKGLTELVKSARDRVEMVYKSTSYTPDQLSQAMNFFKQLELARAAVVSARSSSVGFFERRRKNVDNKNLVPKTWYPYANFVNAVRMHAILHPEAFLRLKEILVVVNKKAGLRYCFGLNCCQGRIHRKRFLESLKAKAYELSSDVSRGAVNYCATGFFIDFLKYWQMHKLTLTKAQVTHLTNVLNTLSQMPTRSLKAKDLDEEAVSLSLYHDLFEVLVGFVKLFTSGSIWIEHRAIEAAMIKTVDSYLVNNKRITDNVRMILTYHLNQAIPELHQANPDMARRLIIKVIPKLGFKDVQQILNTYIGCLPLSCEASSFCKTVLEKFYNDDHRTACEKLKDQLCGSGINRTDYRAPIKAYLREAPPALGYVVALRNRLKIQPKKHKADSMVESVNIFVGTQEAVSQRRIVTNASGMTMIDNPFNRHAEALPTTAPQAVTSEQAVMAFGPTTIVLKGKRQVRKPTTRHQFMPQVPSTDSPTHATQVVPRLPTRRLRAAPPPPPLPAAAPPLPAAAPPLPAAVPPLPAAALPLIPRANSSASSASTGSTVSTMGLRDLFGEPGAVQPPATIPEEVVLEVETLNPACGTSTATRPRTVSVESDHSDHSLESASSRSSDGSLESTNSRTALIAAEAPRGRKKLSALDAFDPVV